MATVERPDIPNILNREFDVLASDHVWCGDIICIWAQGKWRYLAVVLDLFARRVVVWAFSGKPFSADRHNGVCWSSRCKRLVSTDANGWSVGTQMSGQVHAITNLRYWADYRDQLIALRYLLLAGSNTLP